MNICGTYSIFYPACLDVHFRRNWKQCSIDEWVPYHARPHKIMSFKCSITVNFGPCVGEWPLLAKGLESLLLSSLWASRTGSASDWIALQEALYKCIDTIQYNTILSYRPLSVKFLGPGHPNFQTRTHARHPCF